jgi:hypothetical protein
MHLTPENAPDEWFEDEGIKLTDNIQAVFLKSGEPQVVLFTRKSLLFIVPMAVLRDRSSRGNEAPTFLSALCI